MVEMFIRRKVLSLVISIVFVLVGIMALMKMPITQFPDIVPPSVTVTAKYTGANAEVSADAVALPLERAINGVPGMTYMSTVTSNDGLTLIQVFFEVGTDPDLAAVNVQNRVTTILDELPEEVIRAGVTTEKEVNSMLMYLNITSTDQNIKVEIVTVKQAISTLTGVYGGEIERSSALLATNFDILNKTINVDAVIHSRPDVVSNYYSLQASQADAKAAKAAFYPRIDLGASFGLNSFSAETFFKPASLAGQLLGGLMVPVFNKGQLKYEFSIANSEQEIAFLNYQKSVTGAFNELQSILKQTGIFHRVLDLKDEEVKFLDKGIEVSTDLYITGYANYFELINAQKSKLQAELDLLKFQHENTRNNVLLFKALGGKLN